MVTILIISQIYDLKSESSCVHIILPYIDLGDSICNKFKILRPYIFIFENGSKIVWQFWCIQDIL
jgi:hypothetical protein